ncbi:2-nitropropane dioxygenase [Nocardioides mangrovicus]|uniref:2-nitropropane dioxygenase n=1 Tax=Nocardioides mangrovicus TaxID=2478913 RepID=A0A3L8NZV7_9ACTN|nr:nucleotidyltransferase family protein [Nocardioides mangrovicus]RLV47648.1 2-nitropropane dioxygenase [Nocardioides mangrovicus]
MTAVAIDGSARVALAHAVVQVLAERAGVDLLHVKGPALDASLRDAERISTDADVLVRPGHVLALTAALVDHGWRLVTGFASGSVFEHAANYHHDAWGYVDVHRSFPGVTIGSEQAFDLLWADRTASEVAHRACAVPSVRDQALLLCLHAARGMGAPRAVADLDRAWGAADEADRARLRARADELGARVALAAALGELDAGDLGEDRTVPLWRYYSQGGSRVDEWVARLRAAPSRRAAVRTAVRGLGVNREYAAMALGHEPSRRELAGLFAGRIGTGVRQLVRRRDG